MLQLLYAFSSYSVFVVFFSFIFPPILRRPSTLSPALESRTNSNIPFPPLSRSLIHGSPSSSRLAVSCLFDLTAAVFLLHSRLHPVSRVLSLFTGASLFLIVILVLFLLFSYFISIFFFLFCFLPSRLHHSLKCCVHCAERRTHTS